MSERITAIVKGIEAMEPFATLSVYNKGAHESVTVWYTRWLHTFSDCSLGMVQRWYVCGPDTPPRSYYTIVDAALAVAKEVENII